MRAILRRCNQRNEDYLTTLKPTKRKNHPLKLSFGHNMTNDMIAMASNVEERLPPQNVTRKMTNRFGLHLSLTC